MGEHGGSKGGNRGAAGDPQHSIAVRQHDLTE
jgi:hypothetical protein